MATMTEYVEIEGREVEVDFTYDYLPQTYHAPAEEHVSIESAEFTDTGELVPDSYDDRITDEVWSLIRDRQNRGGW